MEAGEFLPPLYLKVNIMDKKDKNMDFSQKSEKGVEKFLQKNYKMIIGILVGIILAVVIVGVVVNVNQKKNDARYVALDSLATEYNALLTLDDTTSEYTDAIAAFNAKADELVASSSAKSYPALKAQYMKAQVLVLDEKWDEALALYEAVAENAKDLYLGPIAMLNAAVCAENAGNQNLALTYYQKIWDVYGVNTPVAPKALFNTARIYEAQGNNELAKATYQQLVDEFRNPEKGTDSEYAALAINRIEVL